MTGINRYQQLAELAVRNSEAYFEDKRQREDEARFVMRGLQNYLQAPLGALEFVELRQDLVVLNITGTQLKLVLGRDNAWHFGIRLRFQSDSSLAYGAVTLKLSLRQGDAGSTLHFERDFSISNHDPSSLDSFLEYVFSSLADDYRKPVNAPKRYIGFYT